MSNLAIVDVLLCTRPGRSLLNKLQIYISCATSSLQTELYRNSGLISQLSQKHMTQRAQTSNYTTTRSPLTPQNGRHHRLLLIHSTDYSFSTAWTSTTDHLRSTLGIDYIWHVETQPYVVQQNGSHLNIGCRTNMPSTRQ